jgi:hypothetical protein
MRRELEMQAAAARRARSIRNPRREEAGEVTWGCEGE